MGPQYPFELTVKNRIYNILLFADAQRNFTSQAHTHSGHEFHYMKEGEGSILIEGNTHPMHSGNCYLVTKGNFHKTTNVSTNLTRISLLINPQDELSCDTPDLLDIAPAFTEFPAEGRIKIFLDILAEYLCNTPSESISNDYTSALLMLIYIELIEKLSAKGSDITVHAGVQPLNPKLSDEARKVKIFSYFVNNLSTATLDELAEMLSLSKRQVARFLNDKMNSSFSSLLQKHRIEHAKALIVSGAHTLDEIAYLSGYNSYKGFYDAFLRYTGVNPQTFKSTLRL
ncbi:MAG: AraC family transcriptional regulator [Oscillospiraceae bacterium]|nr:AraC family transcriptional regulator [Oscillospiraceae bacterium]MBQ6698665.1 AraC family transcriptional regulator [Oscillospiraceae bacterium]MBQ9986417.1 AraC family transcriptional regulator [Oscillospiraceae bacterium]